MFERFTLESALRRAIERNELLLYYQPQVEISSGKIIGVEALIRWHHPEKGLLTPGQFIPVADEMGLLTQIGEWVLHTACQQGRAWMDKGFPPLRVAVNLSAYQIIRSDVLNTVTEALAESGFDPFYLELEITEEFFMQGDEKTMEVLESLRKMGITLAIDDFGTGYSSLSYLKRFPIDRIKIDQSFIRDIPRDADDEAITRAIIAIGHTLKLAVIAEGVETKEQHDFLVLERCDEIQGYLYSPPIPADELEIMLRRQLNGEE
jgi:EAL domain-containing protein (putative c-di-GMP-specific phosphodiesterase class I)